MKPSPVLDFWMFDADSHFYETRDAFTRHLERRYAHAAIRPEWRDGREVLMVGDRPFTFLETLFYDRAVRPGSLAEMLRSMRSGDLADSSAEADVEPAYVHRGPRVQLMRRHGVDGCFMFPTLAVCLEHFMSHDAPTRYAAIRAFNRWVEDQWHFADDGIYAAAYLSLFDVDLAVAELERVLDAGARIINLRAGPAYGRSPADAHFDRFWGLVDEARAVVAFHIGESGYNESCSVAWGETPNPTSHQQSAFQWTCFYGDRPIMETMAAMVFHNLFGRFPNLQFLSVENGSLWVPYLLKAMDKMVGMGRNGPWPGGRLADRPSEIFRRHVSVSPFHEERIGPLVELLGPDRVVFGSDFPHPEGLAEPAEFMRSLDGQPPEVVRAIMSSNSRRLVGA